MYNRILRRPMFKLGGDTSAQGTGITSGLDTPRRGRVTAPGGYGGDERTMQIWEIINRMKDKNVVSPAAKKQAFWSGIGQGFGDPNVKTLGEALMRANQARTGAIAPYEARKAQKESMLDELGVKGEFDVLTETIAKEGRSGSKQFDIGAEAKRANLLTSFNSKKYDLEQELNNPNTEETRIIEIKERDLPNVESNIELIIGSDSVLEWITQNELNERFNYHADDLEESINPDTGENYTTEEAFLKAIEFFGSLKKKSEQKQMKTGGRVGYRQGMNYNMLQDQVTDTIKTPQEQIKMTENITEMQTPGPVQSLSFTELRARLPQEITDEVVQLLASSEQALIDFATIRTQQDIDAFNQKYDVNLVLPQGA